TVGGTTYLGNGRKLSDDVIRPVWPSSPTTTWPVGDLDPEPGTEPKPVRIITRYRAKNSNLRTQFLRIIRRAKVDPLGASLSQPARQSADGLRGQVPRSRGFGVVGQHARGSAAHYLQTTEEHYQRAAYGAAELGGSSGVERKGAEGDIENSAEFAG